MLLRSLHAGRRPVGDMHDPDVTEPGQEPTAPQDLVVRMRHDDEYPASCQVGHAKFGGTRSHADRVSLPGASVPAAPAWKFSGSAPPGNGPWTPRRRVAARYPLSVPTST